MRADVVFDYPPGWPLGLALAIAALGLAVGSLRKRGLGWRPLAWLASLRAVPLLILVFLIGRPVWITQEPPAPPNRQVVLLMDHSESMSLEEGDATRYQQALDFLREHLLPNLKSAGLSAQALLFAQDVESADGPKLAQTVPQGKRTNLGGAIARALTGATAPPLAVLALTDGMANENADNARALAALVEARVPFVGIGFGSDTGVRILTLRQVDAPPVVSPKTTFSIAAELELVNSDPLPAFDLVLLRDGQMAQKKSLEPGPGSRLWLESFRLTEDVPGLHQYTVQVLPPAVPGLKCVNTLASVSIRIRQEKEVRVLYVQGALTWDYKFIGLALQGDPTLKLTGLTRTSQQSVFRQNVETAGELLHGFPSAIEEFAPFRLIVLSHLKPIDLTPAQQGLLARFCSELGGGVLMIGGSATFNFAWQGSRLEQMLPVTFASNPGPLGRDRPFRLQLTEEAEQHPVFQIDDRRSPREAWAVLPAFTQYGRVEAAKPGAQVWVVHPDDEGPRGRRILMASQRYGAGLSAVICLQNVWRWRLAKDAEPPQFDRFWRQLFRFLSESSRPDVSIHLADQELHPQMEIHLALEKRPNPRTLIDTNQQFAVGIEDEGKRVIWEQTMELPPARPVDLSFRAEKAGLYTVTVLDLQKQPVATRTIEIRDLNLEFQNTGRNMETLRQWASLSDGLAIKAEECRDTGDLVTQIRAKAEQIHRRNSIREPIGISGWVLGLLLACLGAEWVWRKRWHLR